MNFATSFPTEEERINMARILSKLVVMASLGLFLGSCMAWHGSGTEVASIQPVSGDEYKLSYYPGNTVEDHRVAHAKHSAKRYCQRKNARLAGFDNQNTVDESGNMTWKFRCSGR